MPIQAMKFQIEAKTEQYEDARAEIKRILSEMAAFTEAARTERDVFDALNRSFTIQKDAAAAASAARSDLYDAINALHRDYLEFTTSNLGAIMRASAPVMAAMRRELEIDGYDVNYESRLIKRFEQIEADVLRAASEFIDKTIGPTQAADVKRT
jgi:hypothetical protein